MDILGINCFGHDSSATLLRDGVPVHAVEEERLSRDKHTGEFPEAAIRSCLEFGGLRGRDLDAVTFYWDPSIHRLRHLLHLLRYAPQSLNLLWGRWRTDSDLRNIRGRLATHLGVPAERVHFVEHHLAHAASAFFPSGFEESAIFTCDGVGEYTSTLFATGRDNRIERLHEVFFPHSIGDFYSAITEYLGFRFSSDEGKVMGLAPYGDPERFGDLFGSLLRTVGEGRYRLDTSYFRFHTHGGGAWYAPKLVRALGPPRRSDEPIEQIHKDVAAAVQQTAGDCIVELLRWLHGRTGMSKLAIGGGVGLNAEINGRILRETPFSDLFVQPAANDASGSLGSALYWWHHELDRPRQFVMEHAFLGPVVSEDQHLAALGRRGLRSETLEDAELIERVAAALAEGRIVGWFRGRMEYGPRALGHRSILTAPFPADMKNVLNERVKHREPFRPFAPSVLVERAGDYFLETQPSPFMTMVYRTRPERRTEIPAVNHVNDTGRVQTVSREQTPTFYDLIARFGELTGVPVLLNTSFNRAGEPIVNSPDEAISCFLDEEIDLLVLDRLLVDKRDVDQSPSAGT